MKNFLLLIIFFFPLCLAAQNHRYYVDLQANGQLNGQSWTDAFHDLHDALALAIAGDEIWVARGVYHPAENDRTVYYKLPSGVRLYGGFAGTEMLLDERQPSTFSTVLSGDIGMAGDSTDNSYTLLYLNFPNINTLVDGFTFRNAVANDPNASTGEVGASGSALYIYGQDSIAYPTIRYCIFEHNAAVSHGGAVYIDGSGTGSVAPLFDHCQFRYNQAGGNGGAMYRNGASWLERPDDLSYCTFEYNRAVRGACFYLADAERSDTLQVISSDFYHNSASKQSDVIAVGYARQMGKSVLRIQNCTMSDNLSAGIFGTDVFFTQGNIDVNFDSCIFNNNNIHAGLAAGISISLAGKVQCSINNCVSSSNTQYIISIERLSPSQDTLLIISNSLFNKNFLVITINGKLLINQSRFSNNSVCNIRSRFHDIENTIFNKNHLAFQIFNRAIIQNSTFFKNYIYPEGFTSQNDSVAYINNCIFQTLVDYNDGFYNPFIFPFIAQSLKVKNCLFTDTLRYAPINQSGLLNITGPTLQIGADPLFVDTLNSNFRLRGCSPAWNAGDNASALAQGLTTDLDGQPRIVDGQVDIGAYELQPISSNSNGFIQAACFNLPQGAVQWSVDNACPPYVYHWSNGTTSGNGNIGLLPGTYTFTITDSRGRTSVQSAQIPTSSPQVSLAGDTLICPASMDGELFALVNGAMLPVSYRWSNTDTTGMIDQLTVGTYRVTVTDAIGCTDTETAVVVPITPLPVLSAQITPASSLTTPNGSIQVTVQSGQPPYTYAWAEVASSSPNISGLLPGVYHLSVTDEAGCITPFQYTVGVVSATNNPMAVVPGSVEPNPARGSAVLRFGDSRSWQLFSLAGTAVLRVESGVTNGVLSVDLGSLPAGVYFYTFSEGRQVISQDRLLILR